MYGEGYISKLGWAEMCMAPGLVHACACGVPVNIGGVLQIRLEFLVIHPFIAICQL